MPNPGSPESMQQVQQQAPPMSSKTMIGMMLVLVIMMVVMSFRQYIGQALDVVFKYIAFDGQYPVLTLIIAGLVMITISTIVRSVSTSSSFTPDRRHSRATAAWSTANRWMISETFSDRMVVVIDRTFYLIKIGTFPRKTKSAALQLVGKIQPFIPFLRPLVPRIFPESFFLLKFVLT